MKKAVEQAAPVVEANQPEPMPEKAEAEAQDQYFKEILNPKTPASTAPGADQHYQMIRQQFQIMRRKQALRIIQVLNQAGYNARVKEELVDGGAIDVLAVEVQL